VIRVVLPHHLRNLAGVTGEVCLAVDGPVTQGRLLDALEAGYPTLRGTVRHPETLLRRPFVRFFACELDLSHASPDELLPSEVAEGRQPFYVVGAMAGG
jgi:molybdopterin synthase sulfur carrier subunit